MITENYIKQCEKAEEIQKGWKPKCGDLLANEVAPLFIDNWSMYIGNMPTHIRYLNRHFFLDGGGITKGYRKMNKKDFIWLPTQEQLQEMILISEKYTDMFILNNFLCDFMIDDLDKKSRSNMNEVWLAFVMKEKYNKIWNGKDWIKIK